MDYISVHIQSDFERYLPNVSQVIFAAMGLASNFYQSKFSASDIHSHPGNSNRL